MNDGWFLMFLSGVALLVYTYFYHVEYKPNQLDEYTGTLKSTPRTITHGGDMEYKYLLVSMNEYNRDFIFRSCAFGKLNFEELEKLSLGDGIKITVEKNRIVNDAYYSVSWYTLDKVPLLKYESFLSCHLSEWKIGILLMAVSMLGMLYKLYSKGKANPHPPVDASSNEEKK